jgi:hypothetical protein
MSPSHKCTDTRVFLAVGIRHIQTFMRGFVGIWHFYLNSWTGGKKRKILCFRPELANFAINRHDESNYLLFHKALTFKKTSVNNAKPT